MTTYDQKVWEEHEDAVMFLGHRRGHSYTTIGRLLHRTRNACIGRTHRLEAKGVGFEAQTKIIEDHLDYADKRLRGSTALEPRLNVVALRRPTLPRPPKLKKARGQNCLNSREVVVKIFQMRRSSDPEPIYSELLRIDEITPGACKFPLHRGLDGEWRVCGKRRAAHSHNYCTDHHADCFRPGKTRAA